jgi:outer membrane cobalamin receptor
MNISQLRKRVLEASVAVPALALFGAGLATPAFAQDDATSDNDEETVITVTGSRIPQPNLTSISPVTAVDSTEIKLSGVTRTEDMINSLPQAFAGQGGNLANGASGTATADLRGLGPTAPSC